MAAPRVALVSGFWGQNIGNAFFNIGGKWILDQIFGEDTVAFIQDQPGYRTFNKQQNGNPKNDVCLLKYLDIDYIVLQGPCLTETFAALWGETFEALTKRGTKIILLGAAFFRYHKEEIAAARAFVDRYPPLLISTRDSRTYEIVKDWVRHTYDGIDSAFFVPMAYQPFKLASPPYIALNFDRYPEPSIAVWSAQRGADKEGRSDFEFFNCHWKLTTPKLQELLSKKGKAVAYAGHLLDRRTLPRELAGRLVIRPEHRFNPHVTWKIYRQPQAVASDEPYTYFTVYANADLTLADRVHACVATLAYGKPAMLFTPSPRAALFERLRLNDIKKRPLSLDASYLEEQRYKQMAYLRSVVG